MFTLNNHNILLISPEPWNHIFVSKHHYAFYLASKNNTVYFLNPPSTQPLSVSYTENKNIYNIDYRGFVKGMRFLPNLLQRLLIKLKFKKLERLCQTSFEIVWSFDNSVFYDLSSISEKVIKICHLVDLNQNFKIKEQAKSADICLGSTRFIVDKLKKYNKRTYYINHGYNAPSENLKPLPLPGGNKIKVFYAGNLDIDYLDWETIEQTILNNTDLDFVFAGTMKYDKAIFNQSNVFYLGVLQTDELYSYYKESDILMICYKTNEHLKQLANPHKMMEYLGSGKIIVATQTIEYQKLAEEEFIIMSGSNNEFPNLMASTKNKLAKLNNAYMSEQRIRFALNNTYEKQIDKIEHLINQHGK